MKPTCEISLIVPAFREAPTLPAAVRRILQCLRATTNSFELILIDDGSDDNTWNCIRQLAIDHCEVRGLRLSRNYGKDAAISAGLSHCAGRAAIVIDADLQHPPELISEFYRLWKQGYQVVEGVKRARREEPFLRRHCSRLFNALARLSTGLDLQNSSDFKLLSREVIEAWSCMRESRLFFRGMVEWLGFQKAQLAFDVAPSVRTTSRWPNMKLARLSLQAIISFSSVPLRIAHVIALTFTCFGVALGVEALYLRLTHRAVDGFTTVIVLLLLQGGLTLAILALISEYLAAVYEEVKARPRFIVSEMIRPTERTAVPSLAAASPDSG